MAREQGMIEPFEPEQVRYVDGNKVISYGTSSYGYDVRCASEFKIFTNVHTSSVVDPKNFNESSFVSIDALSHPTLLPWLEPSSIFAFPKMC